LTSVQSPVTTFKKSINIPDSITKIAKKAFYYNVIPSPGIVINQTSKLTEIGSGAFNGPKIDTTVYRIPAGVTKIGDDKSTSSCIFDMNTNITDV
jgi:hypothetical protein